MSATPKKQFAWYQKNAISEEMALYGVGHSERFDYLLDVVDSLSLPSDAKLLDIGPGFFTLMLREKFKQVSSLGFAEAKSLICQLPPDVEHFVYDLNESRDPDSWISMPKFDLIVFSEVIEHLYTSPKQVLAFLRTLLAPAGTLIIQTPNAASLDKRLKLMLGLHPYDMIGENWRNPNHYREYTKSELLRLAKEADFDVDRHEFRSYFRSKKLAMKMIDVLVAPLPRLRRGQTIVLRRNN